MSSVWGYSNRSWNLTVLCREEFDPIHPPDAVANLPKEKQYVLLPSSSNADDDSLCLGGPKSHHSILTSLGPVDPRTVRKVVKEVTQEEKDRLALFGARPPLSECLNLHDFEARAPQQHILWWITLIINFLMLDCS